MHGNDMQMRLCIVSSIYGDFWEELGGGGARTHNLLLTGNYKGIFAQVLAYAWFYKSEKIHADAKSAYVHF